MTQNVRSQNGRRKICLLSAAIMLYSAVPGLASASVALPAVALPDSGQALRSTQRNERVLPEAQRPGVVVEQGEAAVQPGENGQKVKVEDIVVTGQDVFAPEELAALYQEQLHKELNFGELNQISTVITQYFRERGYLVAQAYLPAQEILQGRVEIAVVIGSYGDIVLKNDSAAGDEAIKRQLAGLHPGAYVNNRDLERAVLLAGDLAGVAAKLTLYPGKKAGTTDIIVEAHDKENVTKGSFSVNNWGNRFIGRTQGTLYYHLDNAAQSGDSFSLGVTHAGAGLDSGYAGYRLPLAEGLELNLGYSKVRYSLGEEYDFLGAHGTAYSQYANLDWKLVRSRLANTTLQLGYDHKKLEDWIDFSGDVTQKRSHSLSLGVTGDSQDKLWGGGMNAYSLKWYDGRLSGQSDSDLPTGSWQKTTYSLLRQQAVNHRLSAFVAINGQLASTNLDSSEKFSLGGASGVRAYPADEASGDEAWLMTSELHWLLPVGSTKGTLKLIGFYDQGVSHREKHPSTTTDNRRELAAKGLGLSWTVGNQYAVRVDYAWKAGSEQAVSDNDKSGRLWLQGITYF
ncbi:ShlB/FhaC/HecB family hemolysin secretion/activation protein [Anaerospora hongkongensis]|uniref:ShlB/FhaC/HecB family hemolysin secretion/activation protein n=1 Tax=Anaerospora hongkongensis TaxID=244830 RepID=UPI00289BFF73|nr:ShlB/FhaC/HecB family hemolysin secretion/activation protein [Anaerospora hongkongensis]